MSRPHLRFALLALLLLPAAPAPAQVAGTARDEALGPAAAPRPDPAPAGSPHGAVPTADPPRPLLTPVPELSGLLLLAGPVAAGWVAYWRRRWRTQAPGPREAGTAG